MIRSARGLQSADRNGFSDPYVIVLWNGMEVGRTSEQTKTLDPEWDESVNFKIPKRGGSLVRPTSAAVAPAAAPSLRGSHADYIESSSLFCCCLYIDARSF